MSIAYKPEIDGLRAIAVTAVVLYHAGAGGAGFVGVDVFFVISGYLITALLREEMSKTGTISLAGFYARRARRILPACILVISCSLAAGLLLFAPVQKAELSDSAAAAMLFAANLYFQANTGSYFDAPAEQMPLLHLWSLSVEEQFYLLWPAILLLLWRRRGLGDARWIWALGLASFGLSQALVTSHAEWSFYQMPARFWELAVGGAIACSSGVRQARWMLPLGLLVLAVSIVQEFEPFPALGAIPVVAGASLVVMAVHSGVRSALLSSRPMVALGLVSYSWYLWHWPLLAIHRATTIGEADANIRLALCGVALLLAAATYRYVEVPFRRLRTTPVATAGVGAGIALVLAGLFWSVGEVPKWEERFPLAARAESSIAPRICHTKTLDEPIPKCIPGSRTHMGIWGDSMALSWSPAAWHTDPQAVAFTRDACWPLPNYLPDRPFPADRSCQAFNREVMKHLDGLDTLVLVAWWRDNPAKLDALGSTLDELAPKLKSILIIGPTPSLKDKVGACIRSGDVDACSLPRADFDREAAPILSRLRLMASRHRNVVVYDPTPMFCDEKSCGAVRGDVPLYWDSHHISLEVAREITLPVSTQP